MFTQRLFLAFGVVAVGLIGIVVVSAGQGARPASPAAGVSDELLAEVRGLRGDFARATGANIRAQLFVARLQLQEQRVNAVGRQLADVQNRLATLQQGQAAMRERLAATVQGQANLPLEERSDDQVRALTLQLEQGQNREQELRAQQSILSNTVITEQSLWKDFSDRLDALERSLSPESSR